MDLYCAIQNEHQQRLIHISPLLLDILHKCQDWQPATLQTPSHEILHPRVLAIRPFHLPTFIHVIIRILVKPFGGNQESPRLAFLS